LNYIPQACVPRLRERSPATIFVADCHERGDISALFDSHFTSEKVAAIPRALT
jgi:hypothetical protein